MVLLTLLGWSSVPLFLEHFTDKIDFWTANGWRYALSAVLWAPALMLAARARTTPARLWRAAIVPSLFNCAGQVLFAAAPYFIDPGLMTFGLRVQIVFVTVGAALLFPAERRVIRSPGFIAGVALVLAGTLGVILNGGALSLGSASLGGVLMSVASGLLFACYGLSVRRFMHGMRPFVAFAAISQYTAAGMVALMLIFGEQHGARALAMGWGQFALLLLSSLIGIGLGHTFYYTSIARLGVAATAGVIQLQPFVVGIASFFLYGERLTALQWACGGVAVLGAGLVLAAQSRMTRLARGSPGGAAPRRSAEGADKTQGQAPVGSAPPRELVAR